jgi:hypothetical protein
LLRAVGATLDDGLECEAYERGFVWPATKHVPRDMTGMLEGVTPVGAQQGEGPEAGPGRSTARPWSRTTDCDSAERPAGSGPGTPVVGRVKQVEGTQNIVGLAEALQRYQQFGISSASVGGSSTTKLFGVIQPIPDLRIAASVVLFINPNNPSEEVRAWAWWTDGVWVGPRHTYLNGSICAFELPDKTWHPQLGVRLLLNLCSVWLARQLYLRAYGRWPGLQCIHTPLERVVEQRPGELCGCGRDRLYTACCAARDRAKVRASDILKRNEELLRRAPILGNESRSGGAR